MQKKIVAVHWFNVNTYIEPVIVSGVIFFNAEVVTEVRDKMFSMITLTVTPMGHLKVPCMGQASGFPSTKLVRMSEITCNVFPSPISSATIPRVI